MEDQNHVKIDAPSKRALAKATGIALLVALILLFTAVLPAEYGFDPLTGCGKTPFFGQIRNSCYAESKTDYA